MSTEYTKAEGKVMGQIENLIREHHPDLVEVIGRVLVLFRDPGAKAGGQPVLGKHGKVSDRQNAVGDTDYAFFIELNAETWGAELDSNQKEALLFHHLSGLSVEDGKDEEPKYVIRPPDVVGFVEEFERYGISWRPVFDENPLPPLEVVKGISGSAKANANGKTEPVQRVTASDYTDGILAEGGD